MKKILYLSAALSLFIFFSCASSPEKSGNGEVIEQPNLTEENNQKEDEGLTDSSLTEQKDQDENSENQNISENLDNGDSEQIDSEENWEDFSEKVEAEELPELPPLEENEEENLPLLPSEPDIPDVNQSENKNEDNTHLYQGEEGVEEASSENGSDSSSEGLEENSSEENTPSSMENENTEDNGEGDTSDETPSDEGDSDNTESDSEDESELNEEEQAEEKVIVPSRSLTVPQSQLIDITYPGKGWIYQGCIDEEGQVDVRNRYFVFSGRKLGGENTTFTLRSRNPGKYLLHFYKNDALSGTYIDDYLLIEVTNGYSDNQNHVKAPDYALLVPPKPTITAESLKEKRLKEEREKEAALEKENQSDENKDGKKASKGQNESKIESLSSSNEKTEENDGSSLKTVIQDSGEKQTETSSYSKSVERENSSGQKTSEESQPDSGEDNLVEEINYSPDELLKEAQNAYNSKKYRDALSLVDKFLEIAVSRIDEGLFLKGKTLETKSQVQNVKEAVRIYDLLLENYPQSLLWEEAKKRSIFLKRFYINIR
ncbi:MAG: hypothetical protein K6E78_05240 [Treponema sp.]|nr:hypothetical protein [Treponema sp.]